MSFKTTDLCDACEGAQVCELPFLGFGRRRAFAGDIRTARYTDGIGALRVMVNQAGNGQVLVIDAADLEWRALFGDVMAGLVARNGWAGVIVNGQIRDRIEIDKMDIGVKALGTIPRRADIGGRGEMDIPVHFGGVTFTPGARLVADEDGVVVLPQGLTESNIAVADAIAATAQYAAGSNTMVPIRR
ncbi:ribonuclease E activity regulator RraA [Variovorax sp. J22G21]|uniref:ribonuclease E activity regulator RraA n=1 Tax=Variovorax fucosicus TaxID=3053517 RepID=UPI002574C898|nr:MULTISPECIES: ribonuclease E activity regulator RraA [unclassified Variovorax]MDM0037522.1 ribonuclease E activity regulator RraA [Variovorax sp. J22R193]MDM0056808.1 ribonuclease E activity regulator RraA [Variovorax sp. J22G47]MDM0062298.1 ribonuclease E activity regulator RraA [Variovorax sp. J22G21]